MPELPEYAIPGFGGGVKLAAPNQLAEDECRGLANMLLDERGGASKRRGAITRNSGSARVISLYTFYRAGSNPQILAHYSDGSLKYSTDDGSTFTNIATGLSTTNPMAFETFTGKCYFCNGVDNYASWTGSVYTTYASAPKAKYLRIWKDTMWAAGVDADRVYSSTPGDAETWPALNFVDIAKGDGDEITGLDTNGDLLIVPKRRRGFVIYDPATFANRMFDFEKGAESHFSFVHYEQNIFYLSSRGICVFLGDTPSQVVSGNIDPVFQADILDLSKLNIAWGYSYQGRIGWSVVEANRSLPSLQIEYYPHLEKKPFVFHRMPAQCFTTVRKGTTEKLYYGKTSGNKLLEANNGGDDDGTAFAGIIETRWFDMGQSLHTKYFRTLRLTGRGKLFVGFLRNYSSSVSRSLSIELSSSSALWSDGTNPLDKWDDELWGPTTVLESRSVHPDVYGRAISLRLSDAEIVEGSRELVIADTTYNLVAGEWSIFGLAILAMRMGRNL